MSRYQFDAEALDNPKKFYNARFQQGYMKGFSSCVEASRLYTVKGILRRIRANQLPQDMILDYGCGEGRFITVLREVFPHATIHGCDISEVGLRIANMAHPGAFYLPMEDEAVPLPDDSFDLITCIEVLEHVRNVEKSAREIGRLLRPGGLVLISTPCANKYSLEWFYNRLTGGLQPSHDGYGRFATDEPGHLRRLNDRHLRTLLALGGVLIRNIYYRAHLFTTVMEGFRPLRLLPNAVRTQIALLDWHLFKRLRNGATMIAIGEKTTSKV